MRYIQRDLINKMEPTTTNKTEIHIWDAVLTPVTGATVNWQEFKRKTVESVQITEEMFVEACEALTFAESELLTDGEGKLYVIGFREEAYAIFSMPELRFVELAQFNKEGKYCSHRNLAMCADEDVDQQLNEHERYIRDMSREKYESDAWYANATPRAQIVLDAEKSARRLIG